METTMKTTMETMETSKEKKVWPKWKGAESESDSDDDDDEDKDKVVCVLTKTTKTTKTTEVTFSITGRPLRKAGVQGGNKRRAGLLAFKRASDAIDELPYNGEDDTGYDASGCSSACDPRPREGTKLDRLQADADARALARAKAGGKAGGHRPHVSQRARPF